MKIVKDIVRYRWVALRLLFWAAVAIVPSCAGDSTPGSRLSAVRVLGARTQTVADPTQNWPRPGEAFRVTWLLAGPTAPRPVTWAFRATACATNQDVAACRATGVPVPASGAGPVAMSDFPTVEFAAPDAATVAAHGITKIIVDGVVCGGGTVGDLNAPAWSRCNTTATDGQATVDETDVEATVIVRLGDDGNQAPDITNDGLALGDQAWTAGATEQPNAGGGAACAADPGAMLVTADDQARTIVLTTDEADRGTHPVAMPAADKPASEREGLQLSAFTTAGAFETQFGGIEGDDTSAAPTIAVKWTPPEVKDDPIPAEGRLVRFVFVLRDLRGGIDWTTRTACLIPKAQ